MVRVDSSWFDDGGSERWWSQIERSPVGTLWRTDRGWNGQTRARYTHPLLPLVTRMTECEEKGRRIRCNGSSCERRNRCSSTYPAGLNHRGSQLEILNDTALTNALVLLSLRDRVIACYAWRLRTGSWKNCTVFRCFVYIIHWNMLVVDRDYQREGKNCFIIIFCLFKFFWEYITNLEGKRKINLTVSLLNPNLHQIGGYGQSTKICTLLSTIFTYQHKFSYC